MTVFQELIGRVSLSQPARLPPGDWLPFPENAARGKVQIARCDGADIAVRGIGEAAQAGGRRGVSGLLGAPIVSINRPESRRDSGLQALRELTEGCRAEALASVAGGFAFFTYDPEVRRGLLATDRMGISTVFYCVARDELVFGTDARRVAHLAFSQPQVRLQSIFDYLHGHVIPAPFSVYDGVLRLDQGDCLEISGSRLDVRTYWRPRFVEDGGTDEGELKPEFLRVLEAGVSRLVDDRPVGAFLSGGTDSSTVTAMLKRATGTSPRTFSIGFDAPGFDEMAFARNASRHFGAQHNEYYVTADDICNAVPAIARSHCQPFGNSSAIPTYYCARLAADSGVSHLLAGDGGDELFGGNARYSKQRVFEQYHRLPRAVRSLLEEAIRSHSAAVGAVPGIRKVASYVQQASVPMPERLETYNLLARLGYTTVLTPDFLAAIDASEPARIAREWYGNATGATLINKMLALDFKSTLYDNDLRKVERSCALASVAVSFPMLDPEVVDFSLRLSPDLKLRGSQLRYFFKRALADVLPAETIRKTKHGFGLPFGYWLVRHARMRDLANDALLQLRRRKLVQESFLENLTSRLVSEHPDYYGTFVWVLMMLELWFVEEANWRSEEMR